MQRNTQHIIAAASFRHKGSPKEGNINFPRQKNDSMILPLRKKKMQ